MILREIHAKSILSKSGIDGVSYCVNPYVGCGHGCTYCYASFMKRFTGHREPWGSFVDAKVNSPALLTKQVRNVKPGKVFVSSVTDPYQPIESRFRLTGQCLSILADSPLEVSVLTKSPLVLRDLDILKTMSRLEVGITITTDDEKTRELFEPQAPPINERISALQVLAQAGVSTFVFIGPVLPMDPERLAEWVRPYVKSVMIDKMNYSAKTRSIYRRNGIEQWLNGEASRDAIARLQEALSDLDVMEC